MLVVLSEINCLHKLNQLGVHPDHFFTDFDDFRNYSTSFRNATIVVIFAGSCAFNKRLVLNLAKSLMKRADNENDVGIDKVYIFSDITLSGLYSYYRYNGDIKYVDVMRGWDCIKAGVFPWTKLISEEKDVVRHLSLYDMGDAEGARDAYQKKYSAEDKYKDLIVVPT